MQINMFEISVLTTGRCIRKTDRPGQTQTGRRAEPFTDSGRELGAQAFNCILDSRNFQGTDTTGQRDKHMILERTVIKFIKMNLSTHRSGRHICQTNQNRTSHLIISPTSPMCQNIIIPSYLWLYKQVQCTGKTYIAL